MADLITKTVLHNHSSYSLRDASSTIPEIIEAAKKQGYNTIALTDHGTLSGYVKFLEACEEMNVKGIMGVEAYYSPDKDQPLKRHMILMAKNDYGYKDLCKAYTESNRPENRYRGYPRITDEIINEYLAGNDDIIVTSACVGGVIADIFNTNEKIEKSIASVLKSIDKIDIPDDYQDTKIQYDNLSAELESVTEDLKEAKAIKVPRVAALKTRISRYAVDSEEYIQAKAKIDESKEIEKVKSEKVKSLMLEKANITEDLKPIKQIIAKSKSKIEKKTQLEKQIDELKSSIISDEDLYSQAKAEAEKFKKLFGYNFYMEIQNHGIEKEEASMPLLIKIAKELNIKLIAANDSHYPDNKEDSIRKRQLIAATRFNKIIKSNNTLSSEDARPDYGSEDEDFGDEENCSEDTEPIATSSDLEEGFDQLYIKSPMELRFMLRQITNDWTLVDEMINNTQLIGDQCEKLHISKDKHYPKFKNLENPLQSALDHLKQLCEAGKKDKYPVWNKDLQTRLDYELSVINKLDVSDYLCITESFADETRKQVDYIPEKVGYLYGPGRGSAVGSLVCYLSGITAVDPIKYGLIFERFLNPERVSMPK